MRGRSAGPAGRRRFLQPLLLALGVAVALAAGGGVGRLTGWATGSPPETFTVYAGKVPRVAKPRVYRHTQPRISWTSVEIAPDRPAQRYLVTRHLGSVAQLACNVPAAAGPRCTDVHAPAGYRATYTVAATYGPSWVGPASEPSRMVETPGVPVPIAIAGATILPGAAGTPIVVRTAPPAARTRPSAAVSGPPAAPGIEPEPQPSEPAAGAVVPPVVRPPAPPGHGTPGEPAKESGRDPGQDRPGPIELPAPVPDLEPVEKELPAVTDE
ncbi:hypothetical protein [Jidongwangia harbinensis]|uniref:hypothetical protein n=1 Tax=Jidongwangia harbinensis TaxID=2878561 RepID=UPI001CDA4F2D|nr:hypothetical protein [Jidongwangia harbinensis]MCA2214097.1 hypothetical protein [Jidongwangia harbinensis]